MDPSSLLRPDNSPSLPAVEPSGTSQTGGSLTSPTNATGPRSPQLPRRSPSASSISVSSRRSSVVDGLRNIPPSPRQRQPSMSSIAAHDLLNFPPSANKNLDPKFAGREWQDLAIGELVSPEDITWIEMDTTVKDAAMLLMRSPVSVVLIRESEASKQAVSTFDFADLNAYLLAVVGLSKPDAEQLDLFNDILKKAQNGDDIALREIQSLCRRDPLISLSSKSSLAKAIEILGGGVHRLLVTDDDGTIVGIASQLRLVKFFWAEGVHFPSIEQLYPLTLQDLNIGHKDIISINSDAPLRRALALMNEEGLTSIAVVDNGQNVVGNISTKDVRHLTSTSDAPLLNASCMHFISVILSERGREAGRDAVPVFYVNQYSTLAHTVAKLVATTSHRMWVVELPSPAPGGPVIGSPGGGPPASPTVPASALAGANMSGRLIGVVSLTDILNIFAKSTGLHPGDPGDQRAQRRRSSSSSQRPSIDASSGARR